VEIKMMYPIETKMMAHPMKIPVIHAAWDKANSTGRRDVSCQSLTMKTIVTQDKGSDCTLPAISRSGTSDEQQTDIRIRKNLRSQYS
jgi:hypothetical protein